MASAISTHGRARGGPGGWGVWGGMLTIVFGEFTFKFSRVDSNYPPNALHPPRRRWAYPSSTHHNAGLCPVSGLFLNRIFPIRRFFLERSQ